MNPHFEIGLAGHFTMTVSGGKRGTLVLADFDNLILDAGLEHLASAGSSTSLYCQVGTGITAAAAGQTALVNKIADTSTLTRDWPSGGGTYVPGPPSYRWDYKTYRFGTGVAAGNLTEVGIGWATSGSLFSRALIVDGGGSPTTITVLSDETLDVTYTLRVYAPADVTSAVTLAGVSYTYTLRAADMTSVWSPCDVMTNGFANNGAGTAVVYNGAIAATPAGVPAGSSVVDSITLTPVAYVGSSLQRAVEFKWDLSQGNIGGGIKSALVKAYGSHPVGATHAYQLEFSPNIPKDNTKTLKLNFTFSLSRAP